MGIQFTNLNSKQYHYKIMTLFIAKFYMQHRQLFPPLPADNLEKNLTYGISLLKNPNIRETDC